MPGPAGSLAAPPGAAAAPAEPPSRPPVWHSARKGCRWLSGQSSHPLGSLLYQLTLRSTSMSRPLWVSTVRGSALTSVASPTGFCRSCRDKVQGHR